MTAGLNRSVLPHGQSGAGAGRRADDRVGFRDRPARGFSTSTGCPARGTGTRSPRGFPWAWRSTRGRPSPAGRARWSAPGPAPDAISARAARSGRPPRRASRRQPTTGFARGAGRDGRRRSRPLSGPCHSRRPPGWASAGLPTTQIPAASAAPIASPPSIKQRRGRRPPTAPSRPRPHRLDGRQADHGHVESHVLIRLRHFDDPRAGARQASGPRNHLVGASMASTATTAALFTAMVWPMSRPATWSAMR